MFFGLVCLCVCQFVPWSVALENLLGLPVFQFGPVFFNFIISALRPFFVWPSLLGLTKLKFESFY